ncbi:MAG: DUF697 domain-containing protein [Arcobacteraceae bacterium]
MSKLNKTSNINLENLQINQLESINKILEQEDKKQKNTIQTNKKIKKGITLTIIAIISLLLILVTNFTIDVYLTYTSIVASNQIFGILYLSLYLIATIGLLLYIFYTQKNYLKLKNAFLIQNKTANYQGYEEEKLIALSILEHYLSHQNEDIVAKAIILKQKIQSNSIHAPFEAIKKTIIDELDKTSLKTIYKSAQEISLFTAFSPSSALDSIIVIFSSIKLMKKVFLIYGYKTNFFTSLLIYRKILENASLAALMEYADDGIGELIGNSLFSTISLKVAQGIGNGVLILRIGNMIIQSARPFASDGSIGSYKQMVKIFFTFMKEKIIKK